MHLGLFSRSRSERHPGLPNFVFGIQNLKRRCKTDFGSFILDSEASMSRRIIILTEGHTEPHAGKTAASVIRYRGHEVAAAADATQAGHTSGELLGAGNVPIVAKLDDVPARIRLLLGIAPPGGKIPGPWRAIILDAIARRKMDVISGLHDFVSDDPEFAAAAKTSGVTIYDVRKNSEKTIARRKDYVPIVSAFTPSATIARSARWSSRSRSPMA